MPDLVTTIVTSALTAIATAYTIGPRLEARNRTIQAAFRAREECSTQLLAMLSYCALLQNTEIPNDATPTVKAAFREERKRWRQGIDDTTEYLIDHLYGYALTFHARLDLRRDLIRAAAALRGTWISDRPESKRLELIDMLGSNLQGFYFSGFFAKALHPNQARAARDALLAKLDELEAD